MDVLQCMLWRARHGYGFDALTNLQLISKVQQRRLAMFAFSSSHTDPLL